MLAVRCPWYVAGPILGLLIVALRTAVNKPLGSLGGYIDVVEHALSPSRLGFSAFILTGTVLGGTLFAGLSGADSAAVYAGWLPASVPLQLGILTVAGLVMGVGARTAGGCTSGHGLTGMSLGSPASIVAAMTFFGTAVGLAHLFAWFIGARS